MSEANVSMATEDTGSLSSSVSGSTELSVFGEGRSSANRSSVRSLPRPLVTAGGLLSPHKGPSPSSSTFFSTLDDHPRQHSEGDGGALNGGGLWVSPLVFCVERGPLSPPVVDSLQGSSAQEQRPEAAVWQVSLSSSSTLEENETIAPLEANRGGLAIVQNPSQVVSDVARDVVAPPRRPDALPSDLVPRGSNVPSSFDVQYVADINAQAPRGAECARSPQTGGGDSASTPRQGSDISSWDGQGPAVQTSVPVMMEVVAGVGGSNSRGTQEMRPLGDGTDPVDSLQEQNPHLIVSAPSPREMQRKDSLYQSRSPDPTLDESDRFSQSLIVGGVVQEEEMSRRSFSERSPRNRRRGLLRISTAFSAEEAGIGGEGGAGSPLTPTLVTPKHSPRPASKFASKRKLASRRGSALGGMCVCVCACVCMCTHVCTCVCVCACVCACVSACVSACVCM